MEHVVPQMSLNMSNPDLNGIVRQIGKLPMDQGSPTKEKKKDKSPDESVEEENMEIDQDEVEEEEEEGMSEGAEGEEEEDEEEEEEDGKDSKEIRVLQTVSLFVTNYVQVRRGFKKILKLFFKKYLELAVHCWISQDHFR